MGDEGRKFLRYVMPGLVYGVETVLFLLILLPEPTLCVLLKINYKDNALGASIAAFFASGALGYIFASIHHCVHWLPCCSCFEDGIFDHSKVITRLLKANLIPPQGFINIEGRIRQFKIEKNPVRKETIAQTISLALWYHFVDSKPSSKEQFDILGNQAHGLGTARIATFFAIVTSFALTAYLTVHGDIITSGLYLTFSSIVVFAFGVFTIIIFHKGYRRVSKFAHEPYTIILQNECAKKTS